MFNKIKTFFNRSKFIPDVQPIQMDTVRLDESLNLLKSTTLELSQAAVSAAQALESQLTDLEFRFISTIDTISDLVVIKDGDGRWKTVNKTGQEVFNWCHGEYLHQTDEDLAEEYPHFKEMFAYCKKTDDLAWEQRRPVRSEELVPNGTSFYYFDVVKTPVFNPDGSRKELIIIGRDVTEIREKSRRTKACFTALNSASDIIFIIDSNARIFFCNDMFVESFNIKDYNKVVGEKVTDVVDNMPDFDNVWKIIRKNKMWEGNCCSTYKLSVLPMMNGAPEPIYYVCTMKKQ